MSVKRKNSYYSTELKEEILGKYFRDGMSIYSLHKEYGIPKPTICGWLKPFRIDEFDVPLEDDELDESFMKDYKKEALELRSRLKKLEEERKFLELKLLSREMMIDKAEEIFGIKIRKKSGAK